MSISCTYPGKGSLRANKICVTTTKSQDGRSLEALWIDYNPDERYSLFLLESLLNSSLSCNHYTVYNNDGVAVRDGYDTLHHPKRV